MILCVKIRLMINSRRTPAAMKILAAIAIFTFFGRVAHTIRRTEAEMRAMQNPNIMPLMMNFLPRFKLTWRIVMCVAAPRMKRRRNTAVIGTSRCVVGSPPMPAAGTSHGP